MVRKLSQSSLKQFLVGIFYLVITIIWSWVSFQINKFEIESGYFEIYSLLKFKTLLPAAILGGRLLFIRYRLGQPNPWAFPISLFLAGWSVFDKLINAVNLHYGLLIGGDILIWSFMIYDTIQTLGFVFRFWSRLPKVNYAMFGDIWSKLNNDLFKIGIWLAVLLGLTFFYLVNFFMIDALLYSRLLLIPLIVTGSALYSLIYNKVNAWVRSDLGEIDGELVKLLNWAEIKNGPELPEKTAWFQHLLLIRNYLKDFQKPAILVKSCLLYLVCSALILSLPYFFGRVIEL